MAEGRPVLVCAAYMPFVTPEVIDGIARADPGRGCAVVASGQGEPQPLLACYHQRALEPLSKLLPGSLAPMRDAVAALKPVLYEVEDPDVLFNVNSPSDLLQAAAMIDRRRNRRGKGA
jgi:molybdopterin-guanine dinucleotide biosynthesis protein A